MMPDYAHRWRTTTQGYHEYLNSKKSLLAHFEILHIVQLGLGLKWASTTTLHPTTPHPTTPHHQELLDDF